MTEQRNTSGKSPAGADVAGGGAGDANAPSPVVTQADRDAVHAYHRLVYAKIWHDIKRGTNKLDPKGGDTDDLVQAFARHREAEQERCAHMLNQKAASLEVLGRATDNRQCLAIASEFSWFADYILRGGQ